MARSAEAQIRADRHTLTIVGTGTIVLAVWSVAKLALLTTLRNTLQVELDSLGTVGYVVFLIVFVLIVLIDMALRVFIGLSARREGKGEKVSVAYVVLAAILACTHVASCFFDVYAVTTHEMALMDAFVSLLIDATSAVALFSLIAAGIRLRRADSTNR